MWLANCCGQARRYCPITANRKQPSLETISFTSCESALKELRESRRWLRLIQEVPLLKDPANLDALLDETNQLIKIFSASIKTALANRTSNLSVES
jgi:four helix bundle protein